MVIVAAVGCFKDEKQGTVMRIEVLTQTESDAELERATDLECYAFWVKKGSKWEVKSWQDAIDRRITNSDRPTEQLTEPDEVGDFDPEAKYQVALELWAECTFAVIVDKANTMYAYRVYDTPMNLPEVLTSLHIYSWRKTGNANGWMVVNPILAEDPTAPGVETTTEQEE